jgi:restriction system protein
MRHHRRGLVSTLAAMQRVSEQAARAHARAAREIERSQKRCERERLAGEKEQVRLAHERKEEEAEVQNSELAETVKELSSLLSNALGVDHRLNFEALKAPLNMPDFNPGVWGQAEDPPLAENYRPKPMRIFARLIPGSRRRYHLALRETRIRFDTDVASHTERERVRRAALEAEKANYEENLGKLREQTARQHAAIDAVKSCYENGEKDGVRQYCEAVLSHLANPDEWPDSFRIAFMPESRQLVIEYDFPTLGIVPETAVYKYIRARKEIAAVRRPDAERRRLYADLIAQASLRVIHILFNADYAGHAESIAFNGHVNAIDQATGHEIHPCLLTLRTTRELFLTLDLARVDPETCLKGLNASVSKRPSELAPVRPVLEFNMADPRFVQEEEVLAGLDNRTNLMSLNPREFEALITNLFAKMGLETRQTRPSRDGGVDCVAYDPRPIFGGKVVIQAKRYKNTVGVSAVRDLYGTVQNEGASKGILVTTSGYGKASFEFANGKPLELVNGSNLLYLLNENAGIEAKIEIPEDWKEPSPDSGE